MKLRWFTRALFGLVGVLAVVAVSASPAGAQTAPAVEWADGADAYEVAVAAIGGDCASVAASDGSVELALATGENWPDALAASALDRPLLLSGSATLHPTARRFVQGCPGSIDIVILGGTAAISQQVQDQLVALGAKAQRIAGTDRYETARKVAEFAAPSQVSVVYLATGANFADAIAAAPRVTATTPLVLTPKAALGADARQFLQARLASNGQVVVLGGTAAVSKAAHDELSALNLNPRRIAGDDRYSTAAMIARESLTDPACGPVDDIAVASGTDPYGGLAAASVRGPCQPLLLAPPAGTSVPKAVTDFAKTWADVLTSQTALTGTITAVGPRSAVSSEALQELAGTTPQGGGSSSGDDPQVADDEQFANDAVRVSPSDGTRAARAWWQRPRGELSVNVHVCAEQGYEHHFAQSDLEDYAAHYNRVIAPFYAWQSSGLLNVSFQPGQIIVSEVLARPEGFSDDWGPGGLAPRDCFDSLPPMTPHVGHAMLVYIANPKATPNAAGRGQLGGPVGTTFLKHDPDDGLAPALRPLQQYWPYVVEHELDHNVGAPHLYGRATGAIRLRAKIGEFRRPSNTRDTPGVWSQPAKHIFAADDDAVLGSLDGYPASVRSSGLGDPTVVSVYPCYELVAQGWPTGDGHPACVRMAPTRPEVSLRVEPDGSARLTWQPPQTAFDIEPVTGYTIELRRRQSIRTGLAYEFSTVSAETVSANTTSYDFPAGTIDMTDYAREYGFVVRPESAVGAGQSGSEGFQVLPPVTEVTATQRPAYVGTDTSIVFDLSWTPAPRASYYRICGFKTCRSLNNAVRVDGTTHVLSEVDEGNSYDFTVLACDDAYETYFLRRLGLPPGCFIYATVTITAERQDTAPPALQIEQTPLGTCSWLHEDTGAVHPCYRMRWDPDAKAQSYFVQWLWGACAEGNTRPTNTKCERVNFLDSFPGGNWYDLQLEPGRRYLVRLYACPGPISAGTCHPWGGGDGWLIGETSITVPDPGGT
ncbi:cell wall-binding repeat-containing protein [Candidatus Poriferisodalis sp.]|uniref:cell wall-binding repeat-containing protein n=1 Tax=Candidatus Poriferisodalis sp. TaxID=3101277 RepID=UPI003B025607